MDYEINEQKGIMDYKKCLDYGLMMKYIDVFMRRYPFLGVTSLGSSVMGKSIPMITLGKGDKSVVYVGAHRADEWLTSIILLRFINEYCELYKQKGRMYNNTLDYTYSEKTIHIVPMLNVDGVDYRINGVTNKNILYDRLLRMNGERGEDFSSWQANGRGVELSLNYNCSFAEYKKTESERGIFCGAASGYSGTSPESEPEVGSLCNFLRFNDSVGSVISLGLGDEQIRYAKGDVMTKKSLSVARSLSRMSGYALASPDVSDATDKLMEWCIRELGVTAFEIKCAEGKKSFSADTMFSIYADMREVLFRLPFLV